jgi:dynein heavy chain, axonemal
MLFSEGFEGAKILAKKMTVLYSLSKEQLSKQFHYDFGLRALKSVLVMAGGLKRQYGGMPEDLVLMRCLRDSNMPKFGKLGRLCVCVSVLCLHWTVFSLNYNCYYRE